MPKKSAEPAMSEDDKIVKEAQDRFHRCEEWESDARRLFIADVKFCNGDSDNLWQWPDNIRSSRELDSRPCLTINKTRQHCLQIINDGRQNKSAIKVSPTGGEATYEAAEVFEGVIRHIEYISNAQSAYTHASKMQVEGGIGYLRVVTDYLDEESFDQELFIRRINDPLSVYIDPDIQEPDGSDARFAFVFDDAPREEIERRYPELKDEAANDTLGNAAGWTDEKHIRVAEYYRRTETKDELIIVTGADGSDSAVKASELGPKLTAEAKSAEGVRSRPIVVHAVEWFKVVGSKIVDRREWPGRYIPIARIVGEELVIDGKLDRKGHTRALKDPQRTYNFSISSAIEQTALQGKSPWVAAMASVEGLETYYETANRVNHAWLPYNAFDDQQRPLPPPQRAEPPVMSQAYVQQLQIAADDMQLVSGQYQSEMGAPSNERSGVAIQQRQRQGDNATYHFIDNHAAGIRFIGRILIDLIPKIYDTPRVIKIMGEDGVESDVQVDPAAQQAYALKQQSRRDAVQQVIFNPTVGRYAVEADIGPAFATRRQEAFNAFSQILAQNADLTAVIGDLMMMNADFPGADEMAERLRRMVPPQALGEGPPPAVAQLQQQLQAQHQILEKLTTELQAAKSKSVAREQQKEIDIYDAITRRLSAIEKLLPTDKDFHQVVADMIRQEHASNLSAVSAQAEQDAAADQGGQMQEAA